MPLFGRSRNPLAVDLGSGQIKVISIEPGDPPRLAALGIEPLEPDTIVGGEVMDYHLVVDILRGLRERTGIGEGPAATAVSGRDVIVKRIKMDRMREQEARQVIRWEAEQHVPFDMESVSLDFEILDPGAEGLQMEVLLVAAKRDLIETRVRLLDEAGFEVDVIDVDGFAIQTAFERSYEHAPYGTFCLVNVGRETTNLNLVDDGRPILTRDLPVGERRFAEALVRELGVTSEEAESRLRGREDGLEDAERKALAEPIESLVTPVERARAFIATSEVGGQLDEIVLSGGGARLPGLRETVAERLETEVTVLDPLRRVEVSAVDRQTIREHGGPEVFGVAMGLGLREAE
ncbi:MAG: type IV pilus assembly protein PilM [Gemmatimonadota bacterium]|nr:type IV pilus assembly protein PilM [Gemmatimonadota bacterium]